MQQTCATNELRLVPLVKDPPRPDKVFDETAARVVQFGCCRCVLEEERDARVVEIVSSQRRKDAK